MKTELWHLPASCLSSLALRVIRAVCQASCATAAMDEISARSDGPGVQTAVGDTGARDTFRCELWMCGRACCCCWRPLDQPRLCGRTGVFCCTSHSCLMPSYLNPWFSAAVPCPCTHTHNSRPTRWAARWAGGSKIIPTHLNLPQEMITLWHSVTVALLGLFLSSLFYYDNLLTTFDNNLPHRPV